MRARTSLTALAAALLAPVASTAQQGTSVFSVLQARDRIDAGADRSGTLTASDLVLPDGRRVQVWDLAARPGSALQVDLRSDDFDAYLYVVGPGLGAALEDDDGGGELNARVCFTASASDGYRIVASSLGSETGAFTLAVAEGSGDCAVAGDMTRAAYDAVPDEGDLALDGELTGSIRAGDARIGDRSVQRWTLRARSGDRVAIELSSSDFDSFVELDGPGFPSPVGDDDGGGGLDSRLCVEIPSDGEYRVFVGPLSEVSTGSQYQLRVRSGDVEAACDAFQMTPAALAEVIAALPTRGRTLEVGGSMDSELTLDDPAHPTEPGRRVQPWSLALPASTPVAVDVVSFSFDPVLYVAGGGLTEVMYNDDADGTGCQSRLWVELPEGGTVTLLPGSLHEGGRGPFLIRATTEPPEIEDGGCVGGDFTGGADVPPLVQDFGMVDPTGQLDIGMETEGYLGDADAALPNGSFVQVWTFTGAAGDRIAIGLSSDDFDAMLYLDGPGMLEPMSDDDGGGGLDSRIEVTLPATGEYRVAAASLNAGEGGPFRLHVVRRR